MERKDYAFVIGDIHGMDHMLEILLEDWDNEEEALIFVGDIIDRGPKIAQAIERVKVLQEKGALVIRGNHEAMLLEFLTDPDTYWPRYARNSGMTTLEALMPHIDLSQYKEAQDLAQITRQEVPWLIDWIESLPLYVEFGDWILVHAGLDLSLDDWRQTEETRFYWIREPFHQGKNTTGKKIVFGHTPVAHLHGYPHHFEVWQEDYKYGIDGGAVYGGPLIGIHIAKNGDYLGQSRVLPDSGLTYNEFD